MLPVPNDERNPDKNYKRLLYLGSLGVKVSSCDLLFFFVNFLLKYVDRKSLRTTGVSLMKLYSMLSPLKFSNFTK